MCGGSQQRQMRQCARDSRIYADPTAPSEGFFTQVTQGKHVSVASVRGGFCRLSSSSCMSCEHSGDPGPRHATVGSLP